jgi:predicted nucleic acid-binding protein
MPDSSVLIETTVLVDFLRGTMAAADYLDQARAEGALVCSQVTAAELIVGSRSRAELRHVRQLLARFQLEPITASDSSRALDWLGKHFHSRGVGFHDWLIAAAASRLRVPVATLNVKHFRAIPSVRVSRPY